MKVDEVLGGGSACASAFSYGVVDGKAERMRTARLQKLGRVVC